jgi:hypothetical protein
MTPAVTPSLYMPNSSSADSLAKLRADLNHFEESGDFSENPTVMEIKAHLLRRIAELEAALRRTKLLESAAPPRTPEQG